MFLVPLPNFAPPLGPSAAAVMRASAAAIANDSAAAAAAAAAVAAAASNVTPNRPPPPPGAPGARDLSPGPGSNPSPNASLSQVRFKFWNQIKCHFCSCQG